MEEKEGEELHVVVRLGALKLVVDQVADDFLLLDVVLVIQCHDVFEEVSEFELVKSCLLRRRLQLDHILALETVLEAKRILVLLEHDDTIVSRTLDAVVGTGRLELLKLLSVKVQVWRSVRITASFDLQSDGSGEVERGSRANLIWKARLEQGWLLLLLVLFIKHVIAVRVDLVEQLFFVVAIKTQLLLLIEDTEIVEMVPFLGDNGR